MTTSKKVLLAGGFLAAAGFVGTATAGAPIIYGKANVSYQMHDNVGEDGKTSIGDESAFFLVSNASRLGVKGSHDLGNGLSAIYQAEYEIGIDDKSSTFSSRNIYAGLKGSAGAIKFGYFDSIMKQAQGKVDQFNDLTLGDIKSIHEGENRVDNTVQYESPKLADGKLKFKAAFVPGEVSDLGGETQDGPADAIMLGLDYANDVIKAHLAYSSENAKDDDLDGGSPEGSLIRASIQGKIENVTLGAVVTNLSAENSADDETAYTLSAAFGVAKDMKLKAQYTADDADDKSTMISVGVDKKLNSKTKLYGFATNFDKDNLADAYTVLGVGMEVKF